MTRQQVQLEPMTPVFAVTLALLGLSIGAALGGWYLTATAGFLLVAALLAGYGAWTMLRSDRRERLTLGQIWQHVAHVQWLRKLKASTAGELAARDRDRESRYQDKRAEYVAKGYRETP